DLLELIGADDGVDLGHTLPNVAAVALDQASGYDQALRAAGLLVLGHFQDRVDRFLLSWIDEAARVDDDHVCVRGMRRELVPAGGEVAHHDLGVDEVLRASEADETDFQGRSCEGGGSKFQNNRPGLEHSGRSGRGLSASTGGCERRGSDDAALTVYGARSD